MSESILLFKVLLNLLVAQLTVSIHMTSLMPYEVAKLKFPKNEVNNATKNSKVICSCQSFIVIFLNDKRLC